MIGQKSTTEFLLGNEAVGYGALAAGVRFFAGYPITPSSEIAEFLSRELPKVGGKFIQMEDEIASMVAIIGASVAGVKSMTATSGPGFSLMQENLGLASMLEIPCVIVNIQRGGPSTGLPTKTHQADMMQARWGSHGDYAVIGIVGASVSDAFNLTIKAVNLSEKYRVPVVLLLEEIIGHMREKVEIPPFDQIELAERPKPTVSPDEYLPYDDSFGDVPPFIKFGEGYRYHITGLTHDKSGFPTSVPEEIEELMLRFKRKVNEDKEDLCSIENYETDDAEILIFAYGSSSRGAKGAVDLARKEGLKVGLMKPIIIWPFPTKKVRQIAEKVEHIVVPELNLGQIVGEVERAAQGKTQVHGLNKINSEILAPKEILSKIKEVIK